MNLRSVLLCGWHFMHCKTFIQQIINILTSQTLRIKVFTRGFCVRIVAAQCLSTLYARTINSLEAFNMACTKHFQSLLHKKEQFNLMPATYYHRNNLSMRWSSVGEWNLFHCCIFWLELFVRHNYHASSMSIKHWARWVYYAMIVMQWAWGLHMYKKKVSLIFINLNKVLAFNTFFIERRYERARKAL